MNRPRKLESRFVRSFTWRSGLPFNRRVDPVAPLAERCVVVADALVSQQLQCQRRLR
jgi:hypothetical protein